MAIFVLVHGGAHGGWCYQAVARLLRARGHEVYAPTMTGVGEREHLLSPKVDLNLHITDIVKVLQFEDLHDVILVGHSYGGMVITGVADRATDRVSHRVYLDAAYPSNGQSLADVTAHISKSRDHAEFINGMEMVLFPPRDASGHFYGVTDPAQITWMQARLTPHPWRCFGQKLHLNNEKAMRQIPESHLLCSSTVPKRNMEFLRQRANGRVWDIDTGHDLMMTEPGWVADKLLGIVTA